MGQVLLPLVGGGPFWHPSKRGGSGGFVLDGLYLCVYVGTLRMGVMMEMCLD